MRYSYKEYEKSLQHFKDVAFSAITIVLDDETVECFVSWLNLALNDGSDIECSVNYTKANKRKKEVAKISVHIGDFYLDNGPVANLMKKNKDDDIKTDIILMINYLSENIRLWCNIKKMDEDLFIQCYKPTDLFAFARLMATNTDSCDSKYEKVIYEGVDLIASVVKQCVCLMFKESKYVLSFPSVGIFIEYNENNPEWYVSALKTYNNEIINFIEDVFSEEHQIV